MDNKLPASIEQHQQAASKQMAKLTGRDIPLVPAQSQEQGRGLEEMLKRARSPQNGRSRG